MPMSKNLKATSKVAFIPLEKGRGGFNTTLNFILMNGEIGDV